MSTSTQLGWRITRIRHAARCVTSVTSVTAGSSGGAHTAETVADVQEEVVQFEVPVIGSTLGNHIEQVSLAVATTSGGDTRSRDGLRETVPDHPPAPTLEPPSETRSSDSEILLED